mgnify:CR=1 FL=1
MSGKETVAFFEGKLKKNMTLQEDSCTLGSNDTYRRQHTTYEVSDKKKGSTFLDLDFLIKDETSSLKGNLSDKKDVDFYNFPFHLIEPYRIILGFKYTWTCRKAVIMTSPYMMNMAIRSEAEWTEKDVNTDHPELGYKYQ